MVEFSGTIESMVAGGENFGCRFNLDDFGPLSFNIPHDELNPVRADWLPGDSINVKIEAGADSIEIKITKA